MKLLFLTYQIAGVGGSYVRSLSLARQLVQLGHEVSLIASRSKPGLRKKVSTVDGVHLVEMPDLMPRRVRHGGLSPIDIFFRCLWILLSDRFDVIHTFEHRPAVILPGLIGRKKWGGLLVSDWADLWGYDGIAAERKGILEKGLGQLDNYFELRSRLWVDGITAITSGLDKRLEVLGIAAERRTILPPGASLDLIRPIDKVIARRKLGLPDETKIVAYSGFAPYDQGFLMEVIAEILGRDNDLIVISTGRVIDHLPHRNDLESLTARWIQYGPLSFAENGEFLAAADILLLPFLKKTINLGRFPNKFGDFLAVGRPIVSHNTGDIGELIEREKLGLLSSENPEKFAEDVLKLLNSHHDREAFGLHARRFAVESWSWAIRAKDLENFYASLLP